MPSVRGIITIEHTTIMMMQHIDGIQFEGDRKYLLQRLCEHQKQMQIMSQQLDGDVNICKPWKQERFRGLGDDAKTLGVVVNVVVATLIN